MRIRPAGTQVTTLQPYYKYTSIPPYEALAHSFTTGWVSFKFEVCLHGCTFVPLFDSSPKIAKNIDNDLGERERDLAD